MKGPRRRPGAARRAELLDQIVTELAGIHNGPVNTAALTAAVLRQVKLLDNACDSFFDRGSIRRTRAAARKLIQTIDSIGTQVRHAPAELRLRLGGGKRDWRPTELRALCQETIKHLDRADPIREWCAREAFQLVYWCTGALPLNGTPRAPYRVVAGALYEIETGKPDHDLRRACDAVLVMYCT
jgi:hypothetical protein